MARPHKKHHKVPATYLHGFTDQKGRLWTGDDNFQVKSGKPESILSERDYYTIRFRSGGGTLAVETKFLNGIEGNYSTIYREKLSQQKPITLEEKARLAIFVASMIERQPRMRESLKKFFSDTEEHIKHLRGLPEHVKKRMASLPIAHGDGPSFSADELLEAGKDVGSFHSSLIPGTVVDIAPIIFDMKWVFMTRPDNATQFITSDNPCSLANPAAEARFGPGTFGAAPGFAQKDVELSLPLSSDMALFCGWRLTMDCFYIPVTSREIEDINRRTKRGARIIVGCNRKLIEGIIDRVKFYRSKVKLTSYK